MPVLYTREIEVAGMGLEPIKPSLLRRRGLPVALTRPEED